MERGATRSVNFSRQDFAVVADAVMARFPLRAGEVKRLARMRELLDTTRELHAEISAQ